MTCKSTFTIYLRTSTFESFLRVKPLCKILSKSVDTINFGTITYFRVPSTCILLQCRSDTRTCKITNVLSFYSNFVVSSYSSSLVTPSFYWSFYSTVSLMKFFLTLSNWPSLRQRSSLSSLWLLTFILNRHTSGVHSNYSLKSLRHSISLLLSSP